MSEISQPSELSARDQAVFRALVVEGRPRVQVARWFGLRPQEVDAIVKRGHAQLAPTPVFHDRRWLKTLRLFRLEYLWQEALVAWQRSQEHEETHKATQVAQQTTKVELRRTSQVGDIRFLELARRLLAEIESVNDSLATEFERMKGGMLDDTPHEADERVAAALSYLQLVIDRRRVSEVIDPVGGSAPAEPGG